jgi:NADH-quinone oxidoreductase subunit N
MWSEWFQPEDFRAIVPQIELTLFACGILLMDFWLERRYKYMNAVTALIGVGFSGFQIWQLRGRTEVAFNGLLVVDSFFIFFSMVFLLATALVILMSIRYLEEEEEHEGEYYALILFAAVGMMFLAGGTDLITLFIGLDVPRRRHRPDHALHWAGADGGELLPADGFSAPRPPVE